MPKPIIVVDTDVLISTAGHPDRPYYVWEVIRTGLVAAVTTEAAISELQSVTAYPRAS